MDDFDENGDFVAEQLIIHISDSEDQAGQTRLGILDNDNSTTTGNQRIAASARLAGRVGLKRRG
jgi:hypothetical protein